VVRQIKNVVYVPLVKKKKKKPKKEEGLPKVRGRIKKQLGTRDAGTSAF